MSKTVKAIISDSVKTNSITQLSGNFTSTQERGVLDKLRSSLKRKGLYKEDANYAGNAISFERNIKDYRIKDDKALLWPGEQSPCLNYTKLAYNILSICHNRQYPVQLALNQFFAKHVESDKSKLDISKLSNEESLLLKELIFENV